MQSNYFISVAKNGFSKIGTIHDPGSKLKVKVVDLLQSDFEPQKGEVQYFVTSGSESFAFETEGYQKKHRNLLILQMIARYCMYLGLFEAQIHAHWPS